MARKYSSEYKALQPYVVEDARKVANAVLAGAASGGGGGGMVAHTIYGPYHTGELLQSQASWAATKAELSNHAALPDVHHAKSHGITDSANHTVTGSQYQIVGLTSANTLGLLTPSSSPTANQVVKTNGSSAVQLVDLTVTGNIYSNGYLDFGTNTMYEDASYLQVTGSKAVRFGQNIGNANWTVYNTGGAQFGGSVDIISGGDLTVAGSGSYAGNTVLFADSSGGNVGIMMAPDSQFALDINGPARATYWIGPHAIQLKNVLLLAHYDGRAPYETNYSGEPNGHMGQVATQGGGSIFRPGKFYKALQCSFAATNLVANPSFETNTTGWSAYGGASVARSSLQALYGQYSMLAVTSGATQGIQGSTSVATASAQHMLSCWVYLEIARSVTVHATDGIDKDLGTTTVAVAAGVWTRIIHTFTTDTHTAITYQVYANGATSMFVDAVQLEVGNAATPYCDGSLGNGHTWAGTAHASTSARTAATLTYPVTGNINAAKGTLMMWVYADNWNPNNGMIWQAGSANTTFESSVDSTGKPRFYAGGSSLTSTAAGMTVGTWHHVAFTWDAAANARIIYVDGAEAGSSTYSTQTLDGDIAVGYSQHISSVYGHVGYIDDFCILERVLPASEIRSVYESNAPVFAETSTFSFRPTPKGLIWADDEGLWMRDTAGSPVLGAYGGEAATKSWAGFTMAAGDLVLGSNAVGSSAIWWDKSAGEFGFYGAGSGTPQVEVNTAGQITFGGGSSVVDAAGLALASVNSWAYTIAGTSVSWYTDPVARTGYAGAITAGDFSAGGIEAGLLFHVSNAFPSDHLLQVKWGTGTVYDVWHGGNIGITSWGGSEYVFDKTVEAVQVRANGDSAGKASTVTVTNGTQGVSSGNGTVKVNGTTARDSTGWLKIYVGTAVRYIPYWTTVTG